MHNAKKVVFFAKWSYLSLLKIEFLLNSYMLQDNGILGEFTYESLIVR